jgi:hypothetical protein
MRSAALLLLGGMIPFAAYGLPADKMVPIAEAAQHAVEQSQLTLPGSLPFHLRATIAETGNPHSDYRADVEEYWISPTKWRRTIQSPGFSQVLIVNGDKTSEQNTSDYYPFWLHDLVTAILDPLPMLEQVKRLAGRVDLPSDSTQSTACLNLQTHSGVPPAQSTLQLSFCFRGKDGLLKAVSTPGYRAEFQDYKPFGGKQVARRIIISPRPGTTISAEIVELQRATNADEQLFVVGQPAHPPQMIRSVEVGQDTARRIIVDAPDIKWPVVRRGKASGQLALYISTDRNGHVREAWFVGSDNPEVSDAARDQVLRWRFQPYVNGVPMQMESVLTFAFATTLDPVPVLNDSEARKLATRVVEAQSPPGKPSARKTFTLRVSVDEHGKVLGVQNPNNVSTRLFTAGDRALRQWSFRPYTHDGKPDLFDADITFKVR